MTLRLLALTLMAIFNYWSSGNREWLDALDEPGIQEIQQDTPRLSLRPAHQPLPFLENSIYHDLTQGRTRYDREYYGLAGTVKTLKETKSGLSLNDTVPVMYLFFLWGGDVTLKVEGDTGLLGRGSAEIYNYDDAGNLRQIARKTFNYPGRTLDTLMFDSSGYLVERIQQYPKAVEDRVYTSRTGFEYHRQTDVRTEVYVHYDPVTQQEWGDRLPAAYDLRFDSLGHYLQEGTTYVRDSLGRITYYTIDMGCGTNSALCIDAMVRYDARGNIAELRLDDRTTRNALWHDSQHYQAFYNELDLPVEKIVYVFDRNNARSVQAPVRYTYEYEYDKMGNWITRREFREGKLEEITRREITYYE